MFRANAEINLRMAEALVWEHTRPRVQFPASRRKNLFGETPNTTRGDAYAPQTSRRSHHFGNFFRHFLQ
jgi:hypothetical protein